MHMVYSKLLNSALIACCFLFLVVVVVVAVVVCCTLSCLIELPEGSSKNTLFVNRFS